MPLLAPRSSGVDISPDGQINGSDQTGADVNIPEVQPDASNSNQVDSGQENTSDTPETFSFDTFKAAKSIEIPAPLEPKKEEVKVEEEVKAEEKDEPKEEVAALKTDTQEDLDKPQPQVKGKAQKGEVDKRDFTGIDPTLIPHFKRMGNDAFAALKPLILSQQEEIKKRDEQITNLKVGKIPDSYYEHERAYMLTPEFEQAVSAANEAEVVYRHWEQQLNEVRQGAKTFKPLVRNQQGQLVYGNDMPADANAETKLMSLFNSSHNQLLTFNGKLAAVSESYKGNYQQAKQWVEEINNKGFSPKFSDPKDPYHVAVKDYINKTMPAAFRSNPLSDTLARSIITNAEMYKLLVQADQMLKDKGVTGKAGNGKPAGKQVIAKQPTNNDIASDAGGGGKGNGSEVTIDMFKAIKE